MHPEAAACTASQLDGFSDKLSGVRGALKRFPAERMLLTLIIANVSKGILDEIYLEGVVNLNGDEKSHRNVRQAQTKLREWRLCISS